MNKEITQLSFIKKGKAKIIILIVVDKSALVVISLFVLIVTEYNNIKKGNNQINPMLKKLSSKKLD